MAKQTLSEQLDKVVEALLGPPDAPLSRADAARPLNMRLAPVIEVIRDLRDLPRPNFKARLKADLERRALMAATPERAVKPIREGFHRVTPYLIAADGPALIEFAKQVFGAEETFRGVGSAGGVHGEVRIGDSMLMMGGGIPGREFRGAPITHALHVYVKEVDAVYNRAIEAGATPIHTPADQSYGSRDGSVKDSAGNEWYISTVLQTGGGRPPEFVPEALQTVTPYLHPVRSSELIEFLKKAFGAEERYLAQSPDGVVHHAQLRIGDSIVEMGDAHGRYQPMPAMFFLYAEDVDLLYERALKAGATSLQAPADQPYGDRVGGVKDPFGNQWYIATHIRDVVM
jgi:PhnB protein